MKITPLGPMRFAASEEQRSCLELILTKATGNAGQEIMVEDFPGPQPDPSVLREWLADFVSPRRKLSVRLAEKDFHASMIYLVSVSYLDA